MFDQHNSTFQPFWTDSTNNLDAIKKTLFNDIFTDIFGSRVWDGVKNEKKSEDKNAILGEKDL